MRNCSVPFEKRLEANRRCPQNNDYTLRQLLDHVNARLMKPQRLVSLSYEEEAECICLRAWWRFDEELHLACVKPLQELAEWVKDPEKFREHVGELIICRDGQIPCGLRLRRESRCTLNSRPPFNI